MSVIQRVGEQDVVLIDRLVPPSQEELIVFVRALRTALLSYNLYPPGHTVTRRRMGEFMQHLTPLFNGIDVLVVACKRDTFEVNDTQILQSVPERDVARELSSFFELRGIRNIVVHRDVNFEELESVFTRWVQKSEDSRKMQTAWLEGLHTPHLRFNMTMANRSEMVIQDGVSTAPLEISREAIQDALGSGQHPSAQHGRAPQGHPGQAPLLPGQQRGRPTRIAGGRAPTGNQPHLPPQGRSGWFGDPSQMQHPQGPHGPQGRMQPQQGQPNRSTGTSPLYSTQERAWAQGQPHDPRGHHGQHPMSRGGTPPGGHGYGDDYGGQAYARNQQGNALPRPGEANIGYELATAYEQMPQQRPPQGRRPMPQHQRSGHYGPPMAAPPTQADRIPGVPMTQDTGSRQRGADLFSTGKFQPFSPDAVAAHAQSQQVAAHAQSQQAAQAGMAGARGADAFQTGQFRPFGEGDVQGGRPSSSRHTPANAARAAQDPRASGNLNVRSSGTMPQIEPTFQPFNPFSSDQLDASGGRGGGRRGADAFGTGQFGNDVQERLRAIHEGAQSKPQAPPQEKPPQQPALAPSGAHVMEHITIDPEAFDHRPPPFTKLDYRQIDPISLFQSRRFQAFLAHGGSGHYLSVFVPPGGAYERHLGGGVMGQQAWLGSPPSQALLQAISSLPDAQLKQKLVAQLAQMLSSSSSQLLEEQLMQIGKTKEEQQLRSEILRQAPQSRVSEMGQRLLRRMVRAGSPNEFERAGQLLQPLIEQQRRRNDWTPLVAVLESLKRLRWDNRSEPWIREKAKQMITHFVPSRTGQQLLYQALCGERGLREQARYGLVAMGVDAAPIFIESLRQLQRRKDLEAMYGLLQEVSKQLGTQQKRLFYGRLWADREPLDGHQKIVLLKGMQQNAPDTLETFLLKELRFAEEQGQEEVLLNCARHAILFHTPGLRQILADLFRSRRFALHQEMEENILKILDKHKTIAAVPMLDEMIHDVQLDVALRASAVWLLGSIKRPEALELLGQVLTSRKRFWRQPKYKKELRLQVLDTFRHFEWEGIKPLLEKAAKDPDREIKRYAGQMLEEDRSFTFLES